MKRLALALAVLLLASHASGQVLRFGDQHWKAPVATAAALPSTGNAAGDARRALDTLIVYAWNGSAWVAASGSGTVTEVSLSLPDWLSVSGSPVTDSGTLAVTPASGQTPHRFIGTCGNATSFMPCAIVAADLPALPYLSDATAYAGSASQGGAANTALALAANGGNCASGEAARGVDASGVAEGCFTPASLSGLGGTDRAIVITSGTSGTAAQGSGATIDASGNITSGGMMLRFGPFIDQTNFAPSGVEVLNAAGSAHGSLGVNDVMLGAPNSNGPAPTAILRGASNDAWLSKNWIFYWSGADGSANSRDSNFQHHGGGRFSFGVGMGRGDGSAELAVVHLKPGAVGPCTATEMGDQRVAADGTFCSCNGSVWTATPLSGSCS